MTQPKLEWFARGTLPMFGSTGIRILKMHHTPKHVAFIMDGNRRYARVNQFDSVVKGHSKGFDQLTKVLEWCTLLGIREITVYAFSLENFKRSEDEVEGLFKMAIEKFERLLKEKKQLEENEVCFRFFGDMQTLPQRLRELVAEVEEFTKDFKKAFLNVCLAYTSQNEIIRAMQHIQTDVKDGKVKPEEISETTMNKALDTKDSLPVDMLIRTSGEHRLSDFLLWQCSNCFLYFDDVLWPDFCFWNLFKAILHYQLHCYRNRKQLAEMARRG
ncbi:Alkyl transferase [Aphelenchoides bicaudatus]|nr:Alkyl transferase [Aphelenchoides bicaudatus]